MIISVLLCGAKVCILADTEEAVLEVSKIQIFAKSLLEAESWALKKLGDFLFVVCFGHIGSMSEE